ncbi:response regulator [Sulfitobacter sp. S190]|nr:response regulator [Sulfitobacter sp. S190]
MLVDDERIDQMMYRRILERSGMTESIVGFTYAEQALEYLLDPDSPAVDLILLDINMPRMTGFEFLEAACERLGERFSASVVIMLTTSLNPKDQARAASFDVVRAYVNKPLEKDNLELAASVLQAKRGEAAAALRAG